MKQRTSPLAVERPAGPKVPPGGPMGGRAFSLRKKVHQKPALEAAFPFGENVTIITLDPNPFDSLGVGIYPAANRPLPSAKVLRHC